MSELQWPSIRLNQYVKWHPEPQNMTAICTMKCRTEPEMDTAHAASPQLSFTFVSDIYINDTQGRTRLHFIDPRCGFAVLGRQIFTQFHPNMAAAYVIFRLRCLRQSDIYICLANWSLLHWVRHLRWSRGQTRQSGSCVLLLRWMHFVGNDKMHFLYFQCLIFLIYFCINKSIISVSTTM